MSKNLQNALSNADKLDGLESTQFVRSDSNSTAQGHYIFQNSNPLPSNLSYTNSNLELRTVDNSAPTLGFHRAGYSAAAIIEQGGQLYVNANYDGTPYKIWHAGNDGTGSGLDADTLDGIQGSDLVKRIEFDGLVDNRLLTGGMVRYFFVDSVNGNDVNDGSTTSPFKTIKKACDSVPVGGFGTILLRSNYEYIIDSYITVMNKYIYIGSESANGPNTPSIDSPTVTFADDGTALTGHFLINNGGLSISRYGNTVKINIGNSGNSVTGAAFDGHHTGGLYVLSALNVAHSNINAYATVAQRLTNIVFRITNITNFSTASAILVDGQKTALLGFNTTTIYDSTGADITTTSVGGVIKDANGVPRNIISNIIF